MKLRLNKIIWAQEGGWNASICPLCTDSEHERDTAAGLRCDVNLRIKTLDERRVRSDGAACQEIFTCSSPLLAEVTLGSLLRDPLSFSLSESCSSTETALGSYHACTKLVQDHRRMIMIRIKSSHDHKPWKPKLFSVLCKRTSISLIPISFSPLCRNFFQVLVHLCVCATAWGFTRETQVKSPQIYMTLHNYVRPCSIPKRFLSGMLPFSDFLEVQTVSGSYFKRGTEAVWSFQFYFKAIIRGREKSGNGSI